MEIVGWRYGPSHACVLYTTSTKSLIRSSATSSHRKTQPTQEKLMLNMPCQRTFPLSLWAHIMYFQSCLATLYPYGLPDPSITSAYSLICSQYKQLYSHTSFTSITACRGALDLPHLSLTPIFPPRACNGADLTAAAHTCHVQWF
jgi:hypothetical protein